MLVLNDPGVTHVLASAVGDEGGAGHDGLQLGDGPAHVPLEAVHPVPEVRGGHPGSASKGKVFLLFLFNISP